MAKKKIPYLFRRKLSCECGYIIRNDNEISPSNGFNCPKCLSHFPFDDIWNFNYEKWDRTADLTYEEE